MQYTTQFKKFDPAIKTKINYGGNSSKTMHLAVEASLKKLRTSYIDILYVHWVSPMSTYSAALCLTRAYSGTT